MTWVTNIYEYRLNETIYLRCIRDDVDFMWCYIFGAELILTVLSSHLRLHRVEWLLSRHNPYIVRRQAFSRFGHLLFNRILRKHRPSVLTFTHYAHSRTHCHTASIRVPPAAHKSETFDNLIANPPCIRCTHPPTNPLHSPVTQLPRAMKTILFS